MDDVVVRSPILDVRGLTIAFATRRGTRAVAHDVAFDNAQGETVDASVRAPALAVSYVPERIEEIFLGRDVSEECMAAAQRLTYAGLAAFRHGMQRGTIVALRESQHDIHLASPSELESAMRRWLGRIGREWGLSSPASSHAPEALAFDECGGIGRAAGASASCARDVSGASHGWQPTTR